MHRRLHPEPVLQTWIQVLRTVESLLMKVSKNGIRSYYGIFHLNVICNMYHSDFDNKQLRVQL